MANYEQTLETAFDEDGRAVTYGYAQNGEENETSPGRAYNDRGESESFGSIFAKMV